MIAANWDPWFAGSILPTADLLPIHLNPLAGAMFTASKAAMPFNNCQQYLSLYLEGTSPVQHLSTKWWVGQLPLYHRRVLDEILAIGLSLSVATTKGYGAYASYDVWNKTVPAILNPWIKPWDGDGPDYLMENQAGGFAFLEVKGIKTECTNKPVHFNAYKAQSVNALLNGIPARHLLSYAYLPCETASRRANVRWFNATSDTNMEGHSGRSGEEQRSSKYAFVSLAIALCHFKTMLQNSGYDPNYLLRDGVNTEFRFDYSERLWIEAKKPSLPRLLIPQKTLMLFKRTNQFFTALAQRESLTNSDQATILRLHTGLERLRKRAHEASPARTRFEVQHRYSNGVCIATNQQRE